MSGYVRQDVTDQIANANTIDAAPLDNEFDAIETAMAAVGGHKHDGSTGEGAPITVVGPAQDVVVSGSSVTPKTDNTYDLGAIGYEWKDLFVDGTANIDSLVADTADINGGTIDGVTIGGAAAGAGTFSSLVATTADIDAGTIDNVVIGGTTPAAIAGTTVDGTTITASVGFVGDITGNLVGNVTGDVTGNADTATALETARDFSLTGDVTASAVSFDGTGNVQLTTVVTDDSHNHTLSTITDAGTAAAGDIGTDVQAYDAGLTSIAGLTTAADQMIYTTASDVYAVATLTSAGRALLDDADAAAQRTTLGLGSSSVLGSDEIAPRGHIYGLTISNNGTDANNDIDISPGQAASDDTTAVMLTLASSITKQLDAAWAVGSGNGGLDTGSKANSTCYFIWLIRRSDTGVVDVLFSTSKTSPTMPTNYDQKRRLPGAIFTDGSGNIRAFTQIGKRRFDFVSRVQDVSATNPGASAVLRTVTVPAGMLGHFEVQITNDYLALTSTNQTDVNPDSSTGFTLVAGGTRVAAQATVAVDGSNQIRSRFNSGGSTVLGIATIAFTDPEV